MTFSQRYGYERLPECLKLNELSQKLRKTIWEAIYKDIERWHATQRLSSNNVN